MYKPLPSCLTIKQSEIEGLGLFATEDIPKGTRLGTSHLLFRGDYIERTPLGGFYNHSNNPNCEKTEEYRCYILITTKDIKAEEEITVRYTLYEVGNEE